MSLFVTDLEGGIEYFAELSKRLEEEEQREAAKKNSPGPKEKVVFPEAPAGTPREETCEVPNCPLCGNNDIKSLQMVTRYMSGKDYICLACGENSKTWRYSQGWKNSKTVLVSLIR